MQVSTVQDKLPHWVILSFQNAIDRSSRKSTSFHVLWVVNHHC